MQARGSDTDEAGVCHSSTLLENANTRELARGHGIEAEVTGPYASAHEERADFRWSVDASVYLAGKAHWQAVGENAPRARD